MIQATRINSVGAAAVRLDASTRAWRQRYEPQPPRSTEVLSRQRFLEHLYIEKRRADRFLSPLSVVVMDFAGEGAFDADDLRDIFTGISVSTRETDIIGHLGSGVVAFLLPHATADAAEAFAALVVERIDTPAVSAEAATYTDARFDQLLEDSLSAGSTLPASVSYAARKSRFALSVKRGIDIVGSIALLLIFAPIMFVTAVAVKVSTPGPVLFRQVRIGRDGVPFNFLKFRSMHAGVDDGVHRDFVTSFIAGRHPGIHQSSNGRHCYKLQSDSRITRVGVLLRKTSIDELPQLVNVLRGEMSLVGPRPPIYYEAEQYQSWHMRRLQEVRPGITGLWQVEGRSKTTFDEMVRLDLRYIRNWSLWLDFKILFKTILVVVRCEGAD